MGDSKFLTKSKETTGISLRQAWGLNQEPWELGLFGTEIESIRSTPAVGAWPTQIHIMSSLGLEQYDTLQPLGLNG